MGREVAISSLGVESQDGVPPLEIATFLPMACPYTTSCSVVHKYFKPYWYLNSNDTPVYLQ